MMCRDKGRVTVATVVDHIIPHRGDQALFWDVSNWQSLCKPHHDSDKQRIDNGGIARQQIGTDGWPI
jgi:5-methylcytosine-specific restriction endonuclease McrA